MYSLKDKSWGFEPNGNYISIMDKRGIDYIETDYSPVFDNGVLKKDFMGIIATFPEFVIGSFPEEPDDYNAPDFDSKYDEYEKEMKSYVPDYEWDCLDLKDRIIWRITDGKSWGALTYHKDGNEDEKQIKEMKDRAKEALSHPGVYILQYNQSLDDYAIALQSSRNIKKINH